MERYLYVAQRVTAMVLGPLVLIHLGLILFAIRGGLTGAEILGRTEGSIGWALFYGLFVVAATIHAPIGLRNVFIEWTSLNGKVVNLLMILFAMLLLVLGLRAVAAVI